MAAQGPHLAIALWLLEGKALWIYHDRVSVNVLQTAPLITDNASHPIKSPFNWLGNLRSSIIIKIENTCILLIALASDRDPCLSAVCEEMKLKTRSFDRRPFNLLLRNEIGSRRYNIFDRDGVLSGTARDSVSLPKCNHLFNVKINFSCRAFSISRGF